MVEASKNKNTPRKTAKKVQKPSPKKAAEEGTLEDLKDNNGNRKKPKKIRYAPNDESQDNDSSVDGAPQSRRTKNSTTSSKSSSFKSSKSNSSKSTNRSDSFKSAKWKSPLPPGTSGSSKSLKSNTSTAVTDDDKPTSSKPKKKKPGNNNNNNKRPVKRSDSSKSGGTTTSNTKRPPQKKPSIDGSKSSKGSKSTKNSSTNNNNTNKDDKSTNNNNTNNKSSDAIPSASATQGGGNAFTRNSMATTSSSWDDTSISNESSGASFGEETYDVGPSGNPLPSIGGGGDLFSQIMQPSHQRHDNDDDEDFMNNVPCNNNGYGNNNNNNNNMMNNNNNNMMNNMHNMNFNRNPSFYNNPRKKSGLSISEHGGAHHFDPHQHRRLQRRSSLGNLSEDHAMPHNQGYPQSFPNNNDNNNNNGGSMPQQPQYYNNNDNNNFQQPPMHYNNGMNQQHNMMMNPNNNDNNFGGYNPNNNMAPPPNNYNNNYDVYDSNPNGYPNNNNNTIPRGSQRGRPRNSFAPDGMQQQPNYNNMNMDNNNNNNNYYNNGLPLRNANEPIPSGSLRGRPRNRYAMNPNSEGDAIPRGSQRGGRRASSMGPMRGRKPYIQPLNDGLSNNAIPRGSQRGIPRNSQRGMPPMNDQIPRNSQRGMPPMNNNNYNAIPRNSQRGVPSMNNNNNAIPRASQRGMPPMNNNNNAIPRASQRGGPMNDPIPRASQRGVPNNNNNNNAIPKASQRGVPRNNNDAIPKGSQRGLPPVVNNNNENNNNPENDGNNARPKRKSQKNNAEPYGKRGSTIGKKPSGNEQDPNSTEKSTPNSSFSRAPPPTNRPPSNHTLKPASSKKGMADDNNDNNCCGVNRRCFALIVCLICCLCFIFGLVLILMFTVFNDASVATPSDEATTTVTTVPTVVCLEWTPGDGKSTLCQTLDDGGTSYGGVGDLVARAFLDQTIDADVAIINAGLCRTDIDEGPFTNRDAERLLPSRDLLVVMDMMGSQIRLVLEEAIEAALGNDKIDTAYPYAAGLRYGVDPIAAFPNRIRDLEINRRNEQQDWIPLVSSFSYTVVTTSYLAAGGDGYNEFTNVPSMLAIPPSLTSESPDIVDVFMDYAQEQETLEGPTEREFSTTTFASADETRTLASVPAPICLDWIPGSGISKICDAGETADQGGGACNVVAWSLLDGGQPFTAEIAIINGGTCQSDIPRGDFTIKTAKTVLPFEYRLVTVEMRGRQIVNVLEQALEYSLGGSEEISWAYPYGAGIRYHVDSRRENGRLINVEVFTSNVWVPIDVSAMYKVVTTTYLAEGNEGYVEFLEIDSNYHVDTGIRDVDALVSYASKWNTLLNPPSGRYSTQSFV